MTLSPDASASYAEHSESILERADALPAENRPQLDRDRYPVDPWALIETKFNPDDWACRRPCSPSATASSACAATARRVGAPMRTARSSTACTRRGRSTTPSRRTASRRWARRSSTLPTPRSCALYVDDEPLSLDDADLLEYSRTLDFATGVLRRELLWLTPAGKQVQVDSTRMVSFAERHLAVLTFEVTVLDADAPVTIIVPAAQPAGRRGRVRRRHARPPPRKARRASPIPRKAGALHRRGCCMPQEYWQDGDRSALSYRVTESGMRVAVLADHIIETENEYRAQPDHQPRHRQERVQRAGAQGRPDPDHQARRATTTPHDSHARTGRPLPPHPRPHRLRGHRAAVREAARLARRILVPRRHRGPGRRRPAAGDPLEPLPARAGVRASGRAGHPGQGRHGQRLRRPLLLGHRDLRPALPRLHEPRSGRAMRSASGSRCCRWPASALGCSTRTARCSRGARSTARRRRPTTRRAPRSTTSTPT